MFKIPIRIKTHVILLIILFICIASLLFIVDILNNINSESRIRFCEDTLRAISHALEEYKSDHKGSPPSYLLELKDYMKGRYGSDSDGIPRCVGNRNEKETSDSSYYLYNPSLSTDENRPICWDSKPHRRRWRLLPDSYVWNVLYADGHVERLYKRKILRLMSSLGIHDLNYNSPEDYKYGKLLSEITTKSAKPSDIASVFEYNYQKWRDFCKIPPVMSSSDSDIITRLNSPYYRNIVKIGPSAIPYIVQKSKEDPDFTWLVWAWVKITGISPLKNKPLEPIEDWWKGGRKQARERFESLYKRWNKGKSVGAYMTKYIRALGIEALPYLVEKVEQGDTKFLEVISELTDGKLERNAHVYQCSEWWDKDKENWLIPFPNIQPVAEAGFDMVVKSDDTVHLDGSASSDSNKDELTYEWIQIEGPVIGRWDNTTSKPVFKAPVVKKRTTLIFQLIVYDGSLIKSVHPSCQSGRSKPDMVKVVVNP